MSRQSKKFTKEQIAEIRHLVAEGFQQKEVAEKFGTSKSYVNRIVHYVRCPDVPKPPHREVKHGQYIGDRETKVHRAWRYMIDRCHKPDHKDYLGWGGRGISVCLRWRESFENFLEDMGVPPSGCHSIDRKENSGNYFKENCRWATASQQQQNKRNNRFKAADVDRIKELCATGVAYREIGRMYGVDHSHIRQICIGKLWKDHVAI